MWPKVNKLLVLVREVGFLLKNTCNVDNASTFKEISFFRKILLITGKTKRNEIFKKKLRKLSDF